MTPELITLNLQFLDRITDYPGGGKEVDAMAALRQALRAEQQQAREAKLEAIVTDREKAKTSPKDHTGSTGDA